MSLPFFPTHRSRVLPTLALAILAIAALPAVAQKTHPGVVGNVLMKNPYVDPANYHFGYELSAGEINGDGISDLAIANPGSTRLRVLRGLPWNVGAVPLFKFFAGTVESAFHNNSMVFGDFDGDGRDEIAIGAPGTSFGGQQSAGGVYVLDRAGNDTWSTQTEIRAGNDGYPGAPQANADLGDSLAAGDFDADGFDDLAIGIRGLTVLGASNAGAVMVVYGTPNGLKSTGAQFYSRSNDGLGFAPTEDDRFGWSLAAGDFDGDGDDDLAIGVPNATCMDGTSRAGGVVELHGSTAVGITNAQSHLWLPGVGGLLGSCTSGAYFGGTLATGRFTALRQHADLAVGAYFAKPGGAVHVLYGAASGLSAVGNQRIAAPVQPGIDSVKSRFGNALAVGDLAHSCFLVCASDSLAVGASYADVGGVADAGAVWVFDSQGNNLDPLSARSFVASASLPIGAPHQSDWWGTSLAVGDFNGDDLADLAIGVPNYDDGGDADAGAVQVFYQSDYIFVGVFDTNHP